MEGTGPITCDRVLIAVGRQPCTDNLGLEDAGVETDQRGFIQVNSGYQTTATVIRDRRRDWWSDAGSQSRRRRYRLRRERWRRVTVTSTTARFPAVIYTAPEIASVGATEDALKEPDVQHIKSGRFRSPPTVEHVQRDIRMDS